MSEIIVNNDNYGICIDQEKKRIYLDFYKPWLDDSLNVQYQKEFEVAVNKLGKGLNVLVDLKKIKVPFESFHNLAIGTQPTLVKMDMKKSGEVVNEKVYNTQMQSLEEYAEQTNLQNRKIFTNRDEAEAWLDEA